MQEILQTAEGVEQLGIVGILAAISIVEGFLIFVLWKQIRQCQKDVIRAIQGKEIE